MKITNSEYKWIMIGLDSAKEQNYNDNIRAIDNLMKKLKNEYERLAKKNTEEGMTKEEEEIYPSRLDTEYGEPSLGRR
jgi:flagellin-specific chaperone FliS|tara:strand:- start:295 stop:528 length:234 start_codon:yes stop_codon:yes gene_type:complete